MGEKPLQGENGGPVIFLQFDALFPGLPERRLWLLIDWCMRKMFGSIHLFYAVGLAVISPPVPAETPLSP